MGPLSVFTQYLRGTHYHWRIDDGMGWVWPLPRTCEAEDLYSIKVELLLVFMLHLSIYLLICLFILWFWELNSEESFVLQNFYISILCK